MSDHPMFDAAREAIRRQVREGIFEAVRNGDKEAGRLQQIEDEVMRSLQVPSIGWALAYVGGARMAPELIRTAQRAPGRLPPPSQGPSQVAADPAGGPAEHFRGAQPRPGQPGDSTVQAAGEGAGSGDVHRSDRGSV